jgi:anaerobic ribonucleoside-triphosphate reductase
MYAIRMALDKQLDDKGIFTVMETRLECGRDAAETRESCLTSV